MKEIEYLIEQIKQNIEPRKQLINLKQEIKKYPKVELRALVNKEFLKPLLSHEDMKVRKNALIIIRELSLDEFKELLFNDYEIEQNWIVKVEIIHTLTSFDLTDHINDIQNILANLVEDSNNSKHIEMIRAKLLDYLALNETVCHQFTGFKSSVDILLTTLQSNRTIVYEKLQTKLKKEVSLGVYTRVEDINEIFEIRDFNEWLIPLKKVKNVDFEITNLAIAIIESELLSLLKQSHLENNEPFRFRIDSSKIKTERLKNDYIRKLSLKIQELSKGVLVNTTSNYEMELRLIETSKQTCQVFLKLYTLKDERFNYRKKVISTTMQPYVAASIASLIYPYTKEEADVLDLCCGVGTLLIERNQLSRCHFMMGIDVFKDAIENAKYNNQFIDGNIHFIQKDLKRFVHQHQFDEIITDLPIQTTNKDRKEIEELYMNFLKKCVQYVKRDGFIFAYTVEDRLFKKALRFYSKEIELVKVHEIKIKKKVHSLFILHIK